MSSSGQCVGMTRRGDRCRNLVRDGDRCFQHKNGDSRSSSVCMTPSPTTRKPVTLGSRNSRPPSLMFYPMPNSGASRYRYQTPVIKDENMECEQPSRASSLLKSPSSPILKSVEFEPAQRLLRRRLPPIFHSESEEEDEYQEAETDFNPTAGHSADSNSNDPYAASGDEEEHYPTRWIRTKPRRSSTEVDDHYDQKTRHASRKPGTKAATRTPSVPVQCAPPTLSTKASLSRIVPSPTYFTADIRLAAVDQLCSPTPSRRRASRISERAAGGQNNGVGGAGGSDSVDAVLTRMCAELHALRLEYIAAVAAPDRAVEALFMQAESAVRVVGDVVGGGLADGDKSA